MQRPRISLSLALLFVLISSATTYAIASTVQSNAQKYQAIFATTVTVTNNFHATDQGIGTAIYSFAATGNNQTAPVTFSNTSKVATDGVKAGDWVLTVEVNTTANTPTNTPLVALLNFNEAGAAPQHFILYLATGSTIGGNPQFEILCFFDLGPTLSAPYGYTFTLQ